MIARRQAVGDRLSAFGQPSARQMRDREPSRFSRKIAVVDKRSVLRARAPAIPFAGNHSGSRMAECRQPSADSRV
jgi:hypothetical protein